MASQLAKTGAVDERRSARSKSKRRSRSILPFRECALFDADSERPFR
jgi:hypothetical protein